MRTDMFFLAATEEIMSLRYGEEKYSSLHLPEIVHMYVAADSKTDWSTAQP